eukprot:TRINITY_DN20038_c0_g2_i1.p1 TRINITY_DN20038_c0_g2~~TRINITY_DN20038_c0_g2_i1.p1  ORF type:complete len:473 (-),score=73.90 TRINITY_DN20038_c0_g2_i1:509-1927(-)
MALYQAPIVVIVLIVCFGLENLLRRHKIHRSALSPLQYPVLLYATFTFLICSALWDTHWIVILPTNGLDNWLVEAAFNHTRLQDGQGDATYLEWKQNVSLEGYEIIRLLSLGAIFAVFGTYAVCLYHTVGHLMKVAASGKTLQKSKLHDMTITILSLPMVYGIMSYKSVFRCFQIITNNVGQWQEHWYNTFEERKIFLEEMYESNFVVGDIYEAYALLVFGKLTIKVVKRALKETLVQRVHSADAPRERRKTTLPTREGSFHLSQVRGQGDEVIDWTLVLVDSMTELTTDGIKLFVMSCSLQAFYLLTLSTCAYMKWLPEYFGEGGYLQDDHRKFGVARFFLGAGFVASFAAIGNIMRIEQRFHHALEEFEPFLKFWGTKILVSLAFVQTLLFKVLPPFSSLSKERSDLLFAILLCYECFFVALLQLKAWHHEGSWFHDKEFDMSPLTQKLLHEDTDDDSPSADYIENLRFT